MIVKGAIIIVIIMITVDKITAIEAIKTLVPLLINLQNMIKIPLGIVAKKTREADQDLTKNKIKIENIINVVHCQRVNLKAEKIQRKIRKEVRKEIMEINHPHQTILAAITIIIVNQIKIETRKIKEVNQITIKRIIKALQASKMK